MQPNFPSRKPYAFGRRGAVGLIAAASAVGFVGKSRAASNRIIDVTATGTSNNADPTGNADSSVAIQDAGNTLLALGGGELFIPPGDYLLNNPISWSTAGASISIIGAGATLSVMHVTHTGTAISYTTSNQGNSFLVRDVGFCATPTARVPGGTALAATFTGDNGGAFGTIGQSCEIENVDFGSWRTGVTVFTNAMVLTGAPRSRISNCMMHTNYQSGQPTGGSFLQLAGECVDVRMVGCAMDGAYYGVNVTSYCEGINIIDCSILAQIGVYLGNTSYSGDGNKSPYINVNGLYVSNCEINCSVCNLNLYQSWAAWISSTDFYSQSKAEGFTSVILAGCSKVSLNQCTFGGNFIPSAPVDIYGVILTSTANGTWPSTSCDISDCSFGGISTAIYLQPGSQNTTGKDIRLLAYGGSALVGGSVTYGTVVSQPVLDKSGNATNEIEWVGPGPVTPHTTDRLGYTQAK